MRSNKPQFPASGCLGLWSQVACLSSLGGRGRDRPSYTYAKYQPGLEFNVWFRINSSPPLNLVSLFVALAILELTL